MTKIIGIDLGTSNSAAAVVMGGKPTIIPAAEGATVGGKAFPSVVAFSKEGDLLVGEPARRQAVTNPDNTIVAAKRKMGSDFIYKIQNKDYKPQQISSFILQKIKKDAEAFVGEPVEKVVITVPAYFDDSQRQATKEAGKIAGLEVERIINEPTAASLAYGLDKGGEQKVAVYDLGGGTFDVSILDLADGVFEVLSTNGDTQLGGDDFDSEIIAWLLEEFKKDQGIDLSKDNIALQRLKEAAEKAKIELSSQTETEISLPFITADDTGPKHLTIKLSRAKLEALVEKLVERTLKPCENALKDAGLSKSDISEVVLVGGMTRMPSVQAKVKEMFGKDPHQGVNPDEVVAIGAAIQAGVMGGDIDKDIVLVDVTPLSFGLETLGGVGTKLIERNAKIPTTKSQIFSTAADNQPSVEIHVVQGEREMAADNKSLGRFILDGIAPAPRGLPQIEVSFDIDTNGILSVKASDKGTGKEQHITIQGSTGLTDEEIENMKKDAEVHAEEDKQKKELVDARNNADGLVFNLEKQMREHDAKIGDDLKKKINLKISDLKDLMGKEDASAEELKTATEALATESQEIGKIVYEAAQEKEAPSNEAADDAGEKVVDAEVVDEKEEEKSEEKKED